MKTFEFRGYHQGGSSTKGLVEAVDLKEARERLAARGVLVQKIHPATGTQAGRRNWKRGTLFSAEVRAVVYEELSALLKAGLPAASALDLLIDSPELGEHRTVLAGIRDRVRDGASFTKALEDESPRLLPIELAAVDVGEQSGNLDDALHRTAGFLEEQRALRDRIVSALMYPAIVLVVVVLVAVGMFGFMLPMLEKMLSDTSMDIPAITRWTLALGRSGGWVLGFTLGGMVVVATLAARRWNTSASFREAGSRRVLGWRVFGPAYRSLVNLRFARTLGLLLRGGVPLLEALPLAGRTTGNPWVAKRVDEETDRVRHGERLADAMARIAAFEGGLPGWIRAGEASGALPEVLDQAADRYQRQWERSMTRLIGLLEPALILLTGAIVFLLALAVILPVLSMNNALQ